MCSKILRFGYHEHYAKADATNRQRLEQEMGDVLFAVELMIDAGDVSKTDVKEARKAKREKAKLFLKHQDEHLYRGKHGNSES